MGGKVSIFNNSGSVDVIGDVSGFVLTEGATASTVEGLFHPLAPVRVLDTRDGTGAPLGRVGAGGQVDVVVTGVGGVPVSGVSAVVLNVTAVLPSAATHVSVWPAGEVLPGVSNLNLSAGEVRPNRVVVKVGVGGKVSLRNNSGQVDLLADLGGWFTDGSDVRGSGAYFTGMVPTRFADTRDGTGGPKAPLVAGSSRSVQIAGAHGVPAMSAAVPPTAVVANITTVGSTATSHVTVWPSGTPKPNASDLNFGPGKVIPNLTVVKLGSGGAIDLATNSGQVDVIVDVLGYYSGDIVVASNRVVVDGAAVSSVTGVTASTVTFSVVPAGLGVGTFLVIGVGPLTPFGAIRLVTAVNGSTVTTIDAGLGDVVKVGSVHTAHQMAAATLPGSTPSTTVMAPADLGGPAPGAPAAIGGPAALSAGGRPAYTDIPLEPRPGVLEPFSKTLYDSGGVKATIDGSLDIGGYVDIWLDFGWQRIDTTVKSHLEADAKLTLTVTGEVGTATGPGGIKIADWHGAGFMVLIADVPTWINPELRVTASASANVKAAVTVGMQAHASGKADIFCKDYIDCHSLTNFAADFTPVGPDATVEATAQVELEPFFEVEIDRIGRIGTGLTPYLKATTDICNLTIDAGLNARGNINLGAAGLQALTRLIPGFSNVGTIDKDLDYTTPPYQITEHQLFNGPTGLCGSWTGMFSATGTAALAPDIVSSQFAISSRSSTPSLPGAWSFDEHRVEDDVWCLGNQVHFYASTDPQDIIGPPGNIPMADNGAGKWSLFSYPSNLPTNLDTRYDVQGSLVPRYPGYTGCTGGVSTNQNGDFVMGADGIGRTQIGDCIYLGMNPEVTKHPIQDSVMAGSFTIGFDPSTSDHGWTGSCAGKFRFTRRPDNDGDGIPNATDAAPDTPDPL